MRILHRLIRAFTINRHYSKLAKALEEEGRQSKNEYDRVIKEKKAGDYHLRAHQFRKARANYRKAWTDGSKIYADILCNTSPEENPKPALDRIDKIMSEVYTARKRLESISFLSTRKGYLAGKPRIMSTNRLKT